MRNLRALPVMTTLVAATIAACFGDGPTPAQPTQATAVFYVPPAPSGQECNDSKYIGEVAVGSDAGYAILMPYVPSSNNCSNGGMQGMVALPVFQFAAAGGTSMIGSAGTNQGEQDTPRLSGDGTWVNGNGTTPMLDFLPSGPTISPTTGGPLQANGYATDSTGKWVAFSSLNGATSSSTIWSPGYPCCGSPPAPTPIASTVGFLPTGANGLTILPTTPTLACETSKHCMVQTPTSLVYMENTSGNSASGLSVMQLPKTTGSEVALAPFDRSIVDQTAVAVGLAANISYVALALTNDLSITGNAPGCWIFVTNLTSNTTNLVFSSNKLSCIDVAVDSESVYFTIVEIYQAPDQHDPSLRGRGIGRVSLLGGVLDSIALGMDGGASGPRRVYLDADSIYAVDPLVIGKIAKSALDGHQDFIP